MALEQDTVNIKDNSYKVSVEFKKQVAELKLQRSLDVVSSDAYYKQLVDLRDTYLEKGTADWWRYTKEIINNEKTLIEQQKKDIIGLYTDIALESGKKMDEVIRLQDKMTSKLKNYGSLFEQISITANGKTTEFTSLRDLSLDTAKLESYKKAIQSIKDRGVPQEFMGVLKGMSIEDGTQFANRLVTSNDGEFGQYIADWRAKQDAAAEISKQLYQDETDTVILDWTKKLEQAGLEVPIGFFDSGKTAAENFGVGFLEQIEGVMQKIKSSVTSSMASMMPSLSFIGGLPSLSANTSTTYQNTFSIGTSKDTASEQIQAWKSATQIQKMRGGN